MIFLKIFIKMSRSEATIPLKGPIDSDELERILVRMLVEDFYPYDNPEPKSQQKMRSSTSLSGGYLKGSLL